MKDKISLKLKLSYASAALADSSVYTFINTFFLFFLTTVAGIDPVVAGAIAAVGGIWDALLGPLVGYVSDNWQGRHGRRVPFIFWAAFPLAIATSMMFSTIDAGYTFRVVYYTIMTLMFWGSFTAFFIPYMALGAELSSDYNERTVLRSYAFVFNMFGMVVGMAMPMVIVDAIINSGNSTNFAWQMTGIIVGICALISLLITCGNTKGKSTVPSIDKDREKEKKKIRPGEFFREMLKGYLEVLKLRPLRYIILASIFYLVANTLNSADRIYFFTYNLNLKAYEITALMFLLTMIGIVFSPIVLAFAKRYDKRSALIYGLVLTTVLILIMRFTGIDGFVGACVFSVVFALGNTCYWQLTPAIIYDVCEVDELINGKRREGAVVSLQSISEALSAAISMQVLGIILKLSGFDGEAAVQGDRALLWLENSFSLLPAFFMVLSIIMLIKYPITKKVFEDILKQISRKRSGEKSDLSLLKKIQ